MVCTLAKAFLNCSLGVIPLVAVQHSSMPAGMSHEDHKKQMAEMKQRGDAAMGFDQDKVRHHFLLTPNGGVIEVSVNGEAGAATLLQIREHLQSISKQFTAGDFKSPLATHAEAPAGVSVMMDRKDRIRYAYEETPYGAKVVINTKDRKARTAVHDFLRYQIREHATGDPITPPSSRATPPK